MTTRIRHILVAVGDEHRTTKTELGKAAALARAAGASVELFHAMTEPDPGAGYPETLSAKTVRERRAALAAKHQRRLEHLASDPTWRGVRVTCTAVWDHPPHEAIIRQSLRSGADLVIVATRGHLPGARWLLRNTDWELIRHCPVPVLLVKSHRPWLRPTVLASVDPFHAHARPADLDARLLKAGESFAELLRGKLHVFHAYWPLISYGPEPLSGAPVAILPPEVQALHERQVVRAIDRLAVTAGIPRRRRHVCMGDVSDELQALTHRTRAGLVVMGAVSRSALKRFFIGNTAERVLDKLECDVLVVKPRGFKSQVSRRATGRLSSSRRVPAKARAASRPRGVAGSTVTTTSVALPPA
jgi:universal stress protein E